MDSIDDELDCIKYEQYGSPILDAIASALEKIDTSIGPVTPPNNSQSS